MLKKLKEVLFPESNSEGAEIAAGLSKILIGLVLFMIMAFAFWIVLPLFSELADARNRNPAEVIDQQPTTICYMIDSDKEDFS